jgi:hypothetical protein
LQSHKEQDDVKLGRKLATGGFGTVFRGDMVISDAKDESCEEMPVIVKKARLGAVHNLRKQTS